MKAASFTVLVGSWLFTGIAAAQTSTTPLHKDEPARLRFEKIASIKALDHPRNPGAHLVTVNQTKDTAAVAMYGCRTVFWNLKENQPVGEPTRQSGDVGAIAFIPNSDLVSIADWNNLQVWNYRTAKRNGEGYEHTLREDSVMAPAVSHDGTRLVTRSQMKSLQFWNLKTQQSIGPEHEQNALVSKLQFTADSRWCFSKSGSLFIWNPRTGKPAAGPITNNIYATAYLPEKQYLATFEHDWKNVLSQSRVTIRSGAAGWKTVRQLQLPGQAKDAEWIDEDRLLVVGRQPGEKFKTVAFIVHLDQEKPRFDLIVNSENRIFDYAISPDRRHLVTISMSKVSCWKIGDPSPKWEQPWSGSFWRKRVSCTDSNWVLAHARGEDAIAYSIEDGTELWRKPEAIYANTADDYILTAGTEGAEVWRSVPTDSAGSGD
jgi:WD40 repeat protein